MGLLSDGKGCPAREAVENGSSTTADEGTDHGRHKQRRQRIR